MRHDGRIRRGLSLFLAAAVLLVSGVPGQAAELTEPTTETVPEETVLWTTIPQETAIVTEPAAETVPEGSTGETVPTESTEETVPEPSTEETVPAESTEETVPEISQPERYLSPYFFAAARFSSSPFIQS